MESGSLIRVSVCLWKNDISDPTHVDLTSNFFCSMYQHKSLFMILFVVGGA